MAAESVGRPRWVRRDDAFAITALLLLGVILPLGIGAIAGSLDVPRNDDWAYRRIALDFARTGALVLNVRTMIIGQILIVQPLLWLAVQQTWAFTATGFLFATWGVLSAYALARQFLPPLTSAVPVALMLVMPGYLAYATSFMSDVPAMAAQLTCLTLGVRALKCHSGRDRWVMASVAVGCVGISFRDFALAAPASVILAAMLATPGRRRYWVMAAAVAVCYGGLAALRIVLYPKDQPIFSAPGGVLQITLAIATVSLALSPVALMSLVLWRQDWDRRDLLVGAELGIVVVASRVVEWLTQAALPVVLLPNLASQIGTTGQEVYLGTRPALVDDALWAGFSLIALAATLVTPIVCAGVVGAYLRRHPGRPWLLVRRLGSATGVVGLFSVAGAVGLALFGLGNPLLDRYTWPLVPPIAMLLLYASLRRGVARGGRSAHRRAVAVVPATAWAVLGSFAFVLALNSNAFDAALWQGGEELTGAGIPASEIDAGYAWVGFHASVPPSGTGSSPLFYRRLWPQFRQCGSVTSAPSPQPGTRLVAIKTYSLYLIAGPAEPLYLYRSLDSPCGSG